MQLAFEILALPDMSLAKYCETFGPDAGDIVATRLFDLYNLLAVQSSDFTISLRYLYTPDKPRTGRIRICVVISYHGTKAAVFFEATEAAFPLISEALPVKRLELPEVAPTIHMKRNLCILSRRHELLPHRSMLAYRVATGSGSDNNFRSPVIDQIMSAVGQPAFLDIQITPARDSSGSEPDCRLALSAAIQDLETDTELRQSFFAREILESYKSLHARLAIAPASRVSILAGSATSFGGPTILASYGAARLGSDSVVIETLAKNSEGIERAKALLNSGRAFHEQRDGWYSRHLYEMTRAMSHLSPSQIDRLRLLSQLRILHDGEAVKGLLTLPVPDLGYLRSIPLETEMDSFEEITTPDTTPGFITLGKAVERSTQVSLPVPDLCRHVFVAGVTGSGKTITTLNIIRQLRSQNIPFLILEPAKSEYRRLLRSDICQDSLKIYTPGKERLNPLRICPFSFDNHIALSEHVANLTMAFSCAMPLEDPMPTILEEAIYSLYERYGWQEWEHGDVNRSVPRMHELLPEINLLVDGLGYDPELASNFKAAFRARFVRLSRGNVGRIFNSITSTPTIDDILTGDTIVELEALTTEQANLVTMFLLMALRERLRDQQQLNQTPRLVVVLEEAHNLAGNETEHMSGSSSRMNSEASKFISRMLVEVRSLGVGIIVVDQSPSMVSPQVIRSTNLKIAHRTVSAVDREILADSMVLDKVRFDSLAQLRRGQAYVYAEHLFRPTLMHGAHWSPSGAAITGLADTAVNSSPTDDEVQRWLSGQSWFRSPESQCVEECMDDLASIRRDVSDAAAIVTENLRDINAVQSNLGVQSKVAYEQTSVFALQQAKKATEAVVRVRLRAGQFIDEDSLSDSSSHLGSSIHATRLATEKLHDLGILISRSVAELQLAGEVNEESAV